MFSFLIGLFEDSGRFAPFVILVAATLTLVGMAVFAVATIRTNTAFTDSTADAASFVNRDSFVAYTTTNAGDLAEIVTVNRSPEGVAQSHTVQVNLSRPVAALSREIIQAAAQDAAHIDLELDAARARSARAAQEIVSRPEPQIVARDAQLVPTRGAPSPTSPPTPVSSSTPVGPTPTGTLAVISLSPLPTKAPGSPTTEPATSRAPLASTATPALTDPPAPSETPAPTDTAALTATPLPTNTPAPTATPAATATFFPTQLPPSPTSTQASTNTSTATPRPTPTITPTPVPSVQISLSSGAAAPLSFNVTNMQPGDLAYANLAIDNDGNVNCTSSFTVNATTSSNLDQDPTNGLQLRVRRCDAAFSACTQIYPDAPLPPGPLIVSNRPMGGPDAVGPGGSLSGLRPGNQDYLQLEVSLPVAAGNVFQNLTSVLEFTFTAVQAA